MCIIVYYIIPKNFILYCLFTHVILEFFTIVYVV